TFAIAAEKIAVPTDPPAGRPNSRAPSAPADPPQNGPAARPISLPAPARTLHRTADPSPDEWSSLARRQLADPQSAAPPPAAGSRSSAACLSADIRRPAPQVAVIATGRARRSAAPAAVRTPAPTAHSHRRAVRDAPSGSAARPQHHF